MRTSSQEIINNILTEDTQTSKPIDPLKDAWNGHNPIDKCTEDVMQHVRGLTEMAAWGASTTEDTILFDGSERQEITSEPSVEIPSSEDSKDGTNIPREHSDVKKTNSTPENIITDNGTDSSGKFVHDDMMMDTDITGQLTGPHSGSEREHPRLWLAAPTCPPHIGSSMPTDSHSEPPKAHTAEDVLLWDNNEMAKTTKKLGETLL